MGEFLSTLLQTGLFIAIRITLTLLFVIVVAEVVFCVVLAMKFRVEKLAGFRERFITHYGISAVRNTVDWEESKNSLFLWLSVFTGNIAKNYLPLHQFHSNSEDKYNLETLKSNLRIAVSNAVIILTNTGRYAMMLLSVPFYLIFCVCSLFERLYRFLLDPVVFFCFWTLAKLKIFLIYHFKGKTIIVDGKDSACEAEVDVIYRKPVIRIVLHSPQDCPDHEQKDNINYFTTTLKSFLPAQPYIKFKTEVVYPNDESILQAELTETIKYLRFTYANLKYIKS